VEKPKKGFGVAAKVLGIQKFGISRIPLDVVICDMA
jgi:hypothetical protein